MTDVDVKAAKAGNKIRPRSGSNSCPDNEFTEDYDDMVGGKIGGGSPYGSEQA